MRRRGSDETYHYFFQQSNLRDALRMSPRHYERFNASVFEDFIAKTLGSPQRTAS